MARKIRTRKQNKNYWSDRMVAIEAMNHETAIDTYRKAEKALNAAQSSIDRDIAYWLMRIAKNNGISMAEARKLLQGAELDEFKWTVEEYIARGRAGGIDEEWMKQLENASARAHITRLEALKLSLRNHIEMAYGVQSAGVSDLLSTVYQNSYHRTAYEVQKGTGIGFTFGRVDTRKLDKIINQPWAADGSNWSDRVWTRKTLMTNTLQNELTRTILSGKAPDEAIDNMTQFVGDNVKNAKAAAGRLVMTESAAIASSAQKDCYKELGVEEFQIIATLDRLTCDVCGPLDEQHFPVKEFGVGASVPPFHPNCRCMTAPYFDDEFEHDGQRAYRGEDGKTHYVEDMSYEEWAERYLGKDREGIVKRTIQDIKDHSTDHAPYKLADIPDKMHRDNILRIMNDAPEPIKRCTFEHLDDILVRNEYFAGQSYEYKRKLWFNLNDSIDDPRGSYSNVFHETGHAIDELLHYPSHRKGFLEALKEDYESLLDSVMEEKQVDAKTTYDIVSDAIMGHKYHSVSDLYDRLSDGRVSGYYTHSKTYWNKNKKYGAQEEAFAHFYEATIRNDEEKIRNLRDAFPTAYEMFLNMLV